MEAQKVREVLQECGFSARITSEDDPAAALQAALFEIDYRNFGIPAWPTMNAPLVDDRSMRDLGRRVTISSPVQDAVSGNVSASWSLVLLPDTFTPRAYFDWLASARYDFRLFFEESILPKAVRSDFGASSFDVVAHGNRVWHAHVGTFTAPGGKAILQFDMEYSAPADVGLPSRDQAEAFLLALFKNLGNCLDPADQEAPDGADRGEE